MVSYFVGIVTFMLSLMMLPVCLYRAFFFHFARMAPNDPSVADSVAWEFVFLAPFIIPLDIGLSFLLAYLAFMGFRRFGGRSSARPTSTKSHS